MATRNPADSIRLKNNILRGVYDENLRIASDRHEPKPPRQRSRPGSLVLLVVVLLLAGGMGLNSIFSDRHSRDTGSAASLASAGHSGQLDPLPTVEIEVPVPIPVNPYAAPTSYILKPPDDSAVQALDHEKLLDYSLLLNNEQVRLSSIFGLNVQTIVIDPGHGGRDPGAVGLLKTREKDIVLDVARRLQYKLTQTGRYRVLLTRDRDRTMSLAERVEFANAANADLFISLHINALPQKSFNVTETYYYGPPSDPETLRLAERENRDSGVLTRDFENMIRKIGNTFKEQESASLAASIQHSLFTNVKKYDKNIADAGIKIAPFVVLLGVDAPAVLVEISCITKKEEELKLNMPAYREEITNFLAQGTIRYLERRNLHVLKGEENDKKVRRESS
jgi:N-acetylmuramoyl-L-alanine amidase